MELCPTLYLGVVDIEKGAFGSHSTMVARFTYRYKSDFPLDNQHYIDIIFTGHWPSG